MIVDMASDDKVRRQDNNHWNEIPDENCRKDQKRQRGIWNYKKDSEAKTIKSVISEKTVEMIGTCRKNDAREINQAEGLI